VTKSVAFFEKVAYNNSAGHCTLYTRAIELTFKRYVISSTTRIFFVYSSLQLFRSLIKFWHLFITLRHFCYFT